MYFHNKLCNVIGLELTYIHSNDGDGISKQDNLVEDTYTHNMSVIILENFIQIIYLEKLLQNLYHI